MSTLFSQDKKNVFLLDQWTDTSFSAGPEKVRFNALTQFDFENEHYAIIGSNQGGHLIRIDHHRLQFVDLLPGAYQHVTAENRDFAVYQNYLYAVCDEGTSTLQIYDISYLPDSVHLVYNSSALFSRAHTICVDTVNAKLYACGTNLAALQILDISNPINPITELEYNGVAYVHDCFVKNDTVFLNCGYDGLRIYRFGGAVPILLGQLDFYVDQGYNHSGHLADNGLKYAFTDETEGSRIKLCHLKNYADIKIDALIGSENYQENIAHELVVLDQLLFCAYYNEGLRVFDLSSSPIREIGWYDTYEQESNFKMNGAWGVAVIENENLILVSDRQSGLFLFYFPVKELDQNASQNTFISNAPFIDQNGFLIPRNYLSEDDLYFSITTITGQRVLTQQNYLNWVHIALPLSAGTYVYSIFNADNNLLEAGKFVVVK